MPNIKLGGEWLELEPVNPDIGKLRFKIRPLSTVEQIENAQEIGKDTKSTIKIIEKLILDWELELTVDDQPLLCTKENRELYVPYLIAIEVKDGEGKAGIGATLLDFANNFGNFIKN